MTQLFDGRTDDAADSEQSQQFGVLPDSQCTIWEVQLIDQGPPLLSMPPNHCECNDVMSFQIDSDPGAGVAWAAVDRHNDGEVSYTSSYIVEVKM